MLGFAAVLAFAVLIQTHSKELKALTPKHTTAADILSDRTRHVTDQVPLEVTVLGKSAVLLRPAPVAGRPVVASAPGRFHPASLGPQAVRTPTLKVRAGDDDRGEKGPSLPSDRNSENIAMNLRGNRPPMPKVDGSDGAGRVGEAAYWLEHAKIWQALALNLVHETAGTTTLGTQRRAGWENFIINWLVKAATEAEVLEKASKGIAEKPASDAEVEQWTEASANTISSEWIEVAKACRREPGAGPEKIAEEASRVAAKAARATGKQARSTEEIAMAAGKEDVAEAWGIAADEWERSARHLTGSSSVANFFIS
eukprot:gnl/TRDRNA2_/TRDRNA2_80663_c0_seq1.p1 gnl/TRDRNA2_/TRDRNA2_80663_c0~~gnl/TRDRNA2_/TRDRNA2_80663_c0_seq1.p1  ORF type:complete len:325 (-),score=50.01 gnl/TRDRNA2_/TRDRNA2_80663_c0_seq1:95-1030(-)